QTCALPISADKRANDAGEAKEYRIKHQVSGRLQQFRDHPSDIFQGCQVKYTECNPMQELEENNINRIVNGCINKPAYSVNGSGKDDKDKCAISPEPFPSKGKHQSFTGYANKPCNTNQALISSQLCNVQPDKTVTCAV